MSSTLQSAVGGAPRTWSAQTLFRRAPCVIRVTDIRTNMKADYITGVCKIQAPTYQIFSKNAAYGHRLNPAASAMYVLSYQLKVCINISLAEDQYGTGTSSHRAVCTDSAGRYRTELSATWKISTSPPLLRICETIPHQSSSPCTLASSHRA